MGRVGCGGESRPPRRRAPRHVLRALQSRICWSSLTPHDPRLVLSLQSGRHPTGIVVMQPSKVLLESHESRQCGPSAPVDEQIPDLDGLPFSGRSSALQLGEVTLG